MPDPTGKATRVVDYLPHPNGIALSPDERTLYVGSRSADLMAYPVNQDGSVGAGTVFASPGASDGLALDCAGNLYVTAGGIKVLDPEGDDPHIRGMVFRSPTSLPVLFDA